MVSNEMGSILNEIGAMLAEDWEYPLEKTLLYAEAERASAGAAIFRDMGDRLLFQSPGDRIFELIHELWDAADVGKKWSTLEYVVKEGQFDASFGYSDDLDPEESEIERRPRVLKRLYGDKPVEYPPLPTNEELGFPPSSPSVRPE